MMEATHVQIELQDVAEGDRVRIGAMTFDVAGRYGRGVRLAKDGRLMWFMREDLEWLEAEVHRKVPEPPQGLGAVIMLPDGFHYVRADNTDEPWWCADHSSGWLTDGYAAEVGFKVLNPGYVATEEEEA